MANMSYCRFENTILDLRDCADNMDDSDLSYEEYRARRQLIRICVQIANDYGEEADDKLLSRAEWKAQRAADGDE